MLDIPVFHDDQHGTAIISSAALLNGLEITGKDISQLRVVVSGAGASAVACSELYVTLGVRRENIMLVDTRGVVYTGRTEGMNEFKAALGGGHARPHAGRRRARRRPVSRVCRSRTC